MSIDATPVQQELVFEREKWKEGPPHELFRRLRGECPVHWSSHMPEFPEEDGYWSITTAEDVHEVSRDWETYSSELGGITAATDSALPLELVQRDVHRDGPAQARPRQGALPARLHAEADRRARGRDPRDRRATCIDELEGRETCDLVTDVAQPVVSRVIGSFMGLPPEDDVVWADADEHDPRRPATRT